MVKKDAKKTKTKTEQKTKPPPASNSTANLDPDTVAKGITVGAFLAGVYFLDKLLAEEKYVKDENDQWVKYRKGIFDELFE